MNFNMGSNNNSNSSTLVNKNDNGDSNESSDNSEIEWENNNKEETLDTLMKEITDCRKRRLSTDLNNEDHTQKILKASNISPNRTVTSKVQSSDQQQYINSSKISPSSNKKKIEPVIFFKVHENPDKNLIEKYLISKVKDIKIEDFKLTANNNVLNEK